MDPLRYRQSDEFLAAATKVLADEIQTHVPHPSGLHAQRAKFSGIEELLNAILREPAEAEPAVNGIDGRLDGDDGQKALRGSTWLVLRGA